MISKNSMKKSTEIKLEIEKNVCKFEGKSLEFAKLSRGLQQFIWTVKNETIFKENDAISTCYRK